MNILVINGPNTNMFGVAQTKIFGNITLGDIEKKIKEAASGNAKVSFFQSNHEGALVDAIQAAWGKMDGIVINPAAYTHTSVAILDALKAVGLPAVEVHVSAVSQRESFRQVSYAGMACVKTFAGHGFAGYRMAAEYLLSQEKQ